MKQKLSCALLCIMTTLNPVVAVSDTLVAFSDTVVLASLETSQPEFGEQIQDWQTRLELARVLSYQKKYPEAMQQYELVLEQKPDRPDIQLELAEIMAYDNRTKESLELLNKLAPELTGDQNRLKVANLYATLKQFAIAQPLYISHLNKFPNDLTTRYHYAEMLTWEKKYDDAAKQYKLLLAKRPSDTQLRRKYALVLIWKGDTNKGKRQLERTLVTENQ
ncbi:MAG: tetratricopeptide repeat protein [Chlamydiales bacterium]|nr:tetratricopeptide repeat protein [Chlamydiales bacterium]